MRQHRHDKLGLTFSQYGALLATKAMLERGDLKHIKEPQRDHDGLPTDVGSAHVFNMNWACYKNKECGSVHCIGGTMALVMGMSPSEAESFVGSATGAMHRLFFPGVGNSGNYKKITTKQAVQAIDNYLRTGEPFWSKVVK